MYLRRAATITRNLVEIVKVQLCEKTLSKCLQKGILSRHRGLNELLTNSDCSKYQYDHAERDHVFHIFEPEFIFQFGRLCFEL